MQRPVAGLGSARGSRAGFGGAPKRAFLELRSNSVPMQLKKFAIARRARQHASRVRYPDRGRYTPKIDKSA
ncbi:MAG: hypothetical protein DME58_11330 [Verrucomicrobia bacterium]|nr:MAG: hypothetical protein DME58_11330 [Verrucomicrobiota bacterium]PYL49365.1 MAG: hypothetical protein DMF32_06840 [Verrucomicrobiota bacterium]